MAPPTGYGFKFINLYRINTNPWFKNDRRQRESKRGFAFGDEIETTTHHLWKNQRRVGFEQGYAHSSMTCHICWDRSVWSVEVDVQFYDVLWRRSFITCIKVPAFRNLSIGVACQRCELCCAYLNFAACLCVVPTTQITITGFIQTFITFNALAHWIFHSQNAHRQTPSHGHTVTRYTIFKAKLHITLNVLTLATLALFIHYGSTVYVRL